MKNIVKQPANLASVFIGIFLIHIILTLSVYAFFNFAISMIFAISFTSALVVMSFCGLENVIIDKDN
jgi:hypothetical protein